MDGCIDELMDGSMGGWVCWIQGVEGWVVACFCESENGRMGA
jgi:hypothetical protein